MRNAFAYNRDQETALAEQLSQRMRGACLSVMRYLVINAYHSPGLYFGHPIERGEIPASVRDIEENTGLSTKKIRNALKQLEKLKKTGKRGAIQGANQTMLYRIENYELWDALSEKGQTKSSERGKQGANPYKKEEKRSKEVPPPTPPPPGARTREGREKEGETIRLFFPKRPPEQIRKRLSEAGFRFNNPDKSWWAHWTPERQTIADEYADQVLPPELQPKPFEYADPGPPLQMPPTDPMLQPVFDYLKEQLRPQIFGTWFAPAAMTLEDDQVVFWTTSEEFAQHIREHYLTPLLQAFEEAHGKVPEKQIQFRVPERKPVDEKVLV